MRDDLNTKESFLSEEYYNEHGYDYDDAYQEGVDGDNAMAMTA